MDRTAASSPLRIVIFPWLAFGHLLPYLELAERLAKRGHRVSYVSTPRNVTRLPPAKRVEFVALPLPRVDGLPDGAESTNDVPGDKFELLWKAFDGLAAPFAEFLAAACADGSKRPDWIVVDSFHHWAAAAALELKVPCAVLMPSAACLAGHYQPETMPSYEWQQLQRFFNRQGASGMSNEQRCNLTVERATLAAMRSCPEWEPDAFPLVASFLGKPLVPLGLLPPSPDGGRRRGAGKTNGGEEDDAALRWLDAQPAGSVVYVALGSEVPLRVAQVHELALGLELAGARFLWALRKPSGVPDGDILPAGFQDRTAGRGLVAMGWVPQMSILAHAAVGAFLTHAGRNSLIEGLLFGRPLVMLPIYGDQGPNARLMEGRKVGLQVARGVDDGAFDKDGVARAVRAVMLEEETRRVFVENARKLQEIVADKELQERYIDGFVEKLRSYTVTDGNDSTTSAET